MQFPQPGFITILGPVTATGTRNFTLTAPRALSFTLTCRGRHIVFIRTTPPLGAAGVACNDSGTTISAGSDGWVNVPARDAGHPVHFRITAPPGTRWLLRIDGSKTTHPYP